MTDITQYTRRQNRTLGVVVIAVLVVVAFIGAYKFATARGGQGVAPTAVATRVAPQALAPTAPAPPPTAPAAGTPAPTAPGAGAPAPTAPGAGAPAPVASCHVVGVPPPVGGVTGTVVAGTARVSGGVQTISVSVGKTYSPNRIKLKAGVPAEITFSQASGCTVVVTSQDLSFTQNLFAGPKLVELSGLKKGKYAFSCAMYMVYGQIVVD